MFSAWTVPHLWTLTLELRDLRFTVSTPQLLFPEFRSSCSYLYRDMLKEMQESSLRLGDITFDGYLITDDWHWPACGLAGAVVVCAPCGVCANLQSNIWGLANGHDCNDNHDNSHWTHCSPNRVFIFGGLMSCTFIWTVSMSKKVRNTKLLILPHLENLTDVSLCPPQYFLGLLRYHIWIGVHSNRASYAR